jgi:hypothetical protein
MSETGTKIGIIGLGVIAVIVAALYYIYKTGFGAVSATVQGINNDDAITTNAARDPGDEAKVSTSGDIEPVSNQLMSINESSTHVSDSLPPVTGTVMYSVSVEPTSRGIEAQAQSIMATSPTTPAQVAYGTALMEAIVPPPATPAMPGYQETDSAGFDWSTYMYFKTKIITVVGQMLPASLPGYYMTDKVENYTNPVTGQKYSQATYRSTGAEYGGGSNPFAEV